MGHVAADFRPTARLPEEENEAQRPEVGFLRSLPPVSELRSEQAENAWFFLPG